MIKPKQFLTVVGIVGILFFVSYQSWAGGALPNGPLVVSKQSASPSLGLERVRFCQSLRKEISNLEAMRDAAYTSAENQSNSSDPDYDKDTREESVALYEGLKDMYDDAMGYYNDHCRGILYDGEARYHFDDGTIKEAEPLGSYPSDLISCP